MATTGDSGTKIWPSFERQSKEKDLIDQVRKFWDRRPCNVRHSSRPIGTREYFDEVESRKNFVEPHIPTFAEFPRWKGKKVLEIGCGIGTDTVRFARHGAWVTAIDLSNRSLELARRRAEVFGLTDRIRFYCGNAEELEEFVPIESYDLIYSFGVIHHTLNPERIIRQMRSYVRPGSTIKVMLYHRCSWKVLWIWLTCGRGWIRHLSKCIARYSEAQESCPVTCTYTRRQARKLLEPVGFRVTELRVDHIFPYRISDYVRYRYKKVWCFRWMPPPIFRWLERRAGWHLLLTATVP